MKKQAIVIGLGQFGMSLARSLSERGFEVLAVDRKSELVKQAATFAAEAVSFNAMDEAALAHAAPAQRDVAVCAIGPESRDSSIICTALLRQLGAPYVISRASDPVHERILHLVGAHEVVNPDREYGERLARRLLYRGIVDGLPLGDDLSVTEVQVPAEFAGRNLIELQLPRRFGVMVVAVRRVVDGKGVALLPNPNDPLRADDILVVVSTPAATERMVSRTQP
jgi:trk system potassium uptake protein